MNKTPVRPDAIHLSEAEVAAILDRLEHEPEDAQALRARLAWRPAWAIRSRRGALAAVLEMFGKRSIR